VNAPARALVVVNPVSANGATGRAWPSIERELRSAWPIDFDAHLTQQPGHAQALVRAAHGYATVLCIGGDGTLHEVVNGLMALPAAERPALAVLPAGTGSDFARMLGVPADARAFATGWAQAALRPIDVGEIAFMRGRALHIRHFINIAGFGFDAAVSAAVGSGIKHKLSYFVQVFKTLLRFKPCAARVTVQDDGQAQTHDAHVMMIAVCNGRYFGGGMHVAPNALPDDGQFDVVTLGAMGRFEFLRNFARVYAGTHLSHPKVRVLRARELRIEPLDGMRLQLEAEGELLGEAPASIRLLPAALRIMR
jgi:diacylglycerol kinase (ATP)